VTDGIVYAVAATPGGVYIGGSFTLLGRPTGSWVALKAGAGVLHRPASVGEPVVAAVADGKRGWFLATNADEGETHLLHLRADGTVDPKWHPRVDGTVAALARSGRRVFLAGDFMKIGGRPHARLAAVDARTGRALVWTAGVAARKPKDFADVEVLEVSRDQRTLYFGGSFARVGGKVRDGLAAVDVRSAKATKWRPSTDGEVYDLAMSRDGRAVYVGGDFSRLGGRKRGDLGAVDARSGTVTDWNPQSNGAVEVITVARSRVYVGGTFTSIGGRSRRATAALDARSANATAWDANVIGRVHAVLPLGKQVYLAGEFESVGGASRSNLASVDAARAR
jgi:hypothetical protein